MKHMAMPAQTRAASFAPESVNEEKRTVEVVWTTGAKVRRYSWMTGTSYDEELVLGRSNVRLDRLNSGAPLLNTHNDYDLNDIIGVVEKAWIDGNEGRAVVRFAEGDPAVDVIWNKVRSGIIRNISVGYMVHKVEKVESKDEKVPTWRIIDWEPIELSAVPIPADKGAGFRSAVEMTHPEFVEQETEARQAADAEVSAEVVADEFNPTTLELLRQLLHLKKAA